MKTAKVILAQNGDIEMEFGGDLENTCCGYEDIAIRKSLEKLGVKTSLKSVFCNLPKPEQVEAKASGKCITNKNERRA